MRRSGRFALSRRAVAAVVAIILLVAAGSVVLFAADRTLVTRALAKVEARQESSGKACTHPCAGGRMLLL